MSTPPHGLQVTWFSKAQVAEKGHVWKGLCVVLDREGTHLRPLNCKLLAFQK